MKKQKTMWIGKDKNSVWYHISIEKLNKSRSNDYIGSLESLCATLFEPVTGDKLKPDYQAEYKLVRVSKPIKIKKSTILMESENTGKIIVEEYGI